MRAENAAYKDKRENVKDKLNLLGVQWYNYYTAGNDDMQRALQTEIFTIIVENEDIIVDGRWKRISDVILVYDINQKRVGKALKICRKYLIHIQKSVFEGNITEAKLKALKEELGHLIDVQIDSVIIYHLDSVKYTKKEQIGIVQSTSNII